MAQPKAAATQEKAVVKWKGEQITVSFDDVKSLICPLATDQETAVFLRTCQSLNLNPFANEIYLIKYSERDKAARVIAIESYLKAAETNDNYNGHDAGILLRDSGGKLESREGSFLLPDEADKLVGGWARVYRKDREKPFYMAVNKAECLRYTRDGKLTQFWTKEKQPLMLRKTALKRALVEAFPSLFAGTISSVDAEALSEEMLPKPKGEMSEGEVPPAYEINGEPYWKKWWAKQKDKGLSEEDVHDILGITSVREDWLGTGRVLEEADEVINNALPLVTRAKQLGLSINQVHDMLGMALKEWFSQGKTADDAVQMLSEELAKPKTKESAEGGEGFAIDLQWLKEAKQTLKWTDETMLSFITSQYKVSSNSITEALNKLNREQAEDFTHQINTKLERQSSLF